MVLISKNFLIENLSVRFAIPVISVIFKNSAAVTNTQPGQADSTLHHTPVRLTTRRTIFRGNQKIF